MKNFEIRYHMFPDDDITITCSAENENEAIACAKRYRKDSFSIKELKPRKCGNCKYRMFSGWGGLCECCIDYEMATTEKEEMESARNCKRYEEGTPSCLENDDYCPSSTGGDYSPSNPWDAAGMSIKDFI